MTSRSLRVICSLIFALCSTSQAALIGRAPATPGGTDYQAYFDDQLGITWTTDAHIDDLLLLWQDANEWAANLTLAGVSGWRLPTVDKNGDESVVVLAACGSDAVACLDNEVAYQMVINGIDFLSPGPFGNMSMLDYWTSTPSATQVGLAWEFNLNGILTVDNATSGGQSNAVWAVHDGDPFAAIPLPGAVWLSASALSLLARIRRQVI